ncbi:MAG: YbhB/YbcL family Raf kinase inhibitor-like protein [Candidatus Nanohaloarchaea archaeon]|nr:YbhB/YbcL family Raf kinase inhibitor-like protein [Candidatus Nanohaloarchaea archaeon]
MRAAALLLTGAVLTAGCLQAGTGSRLEVTSTAVTDGGTIPSTYTCDGANHHPPITVSGVPDDAVTLAITVEDMDVSFHHWLAWNIPANTTQIEAGELPAVAEEGPNSYSNTPMAEHPTTGYAGPCPPNGMEHTYRFTVYAVDTSFNVSDRDAVMDALESHTLATGSLQATYRRTR